ncbi:unnamed protein product [Oikopleura dioica]|uniref:Uncharacterized protein n=1 Tax=Oikopleura dioica TaxID=34765 RepID=E4WRM7_OIKDI|nr:unnamed protein product [Oikopleura dioica]
MFRSQDAYDTHRNICFGGKDQVCFCKICGVRKDSEWTMDKHLFTHYDMDSKGCMDCGWRSDLHVNPSILSEEEKRNHILRLYTDIGKHLREEHMSRPDSQNFKSPVRQGYRITVNALRCMDCNALQDDIKSLQEHIKLCPKSTKPAVFICYCRAEFADRKSFDQHINMMQCKELLIRKFQGLPFVPGFPTTMRPPVTSSQAPPKSPRSPVKLKEQSKVRLQEEETNREYTQKAFPCHECKIGFDSRKHFSAHKQNYCPSRQTDSPGSEGSSSQPTSSSANLLQASSLLNMFR